MLIVLKSFSDVETWKVNRFAHLIDRSLLTAMLVKVKKIVVPSY